MWIHEIKTPIASSKLVIENNYNNDIVRKIDTQINKIDNFVEQVLYYSRSNEVGKDYIIKKVELEPLVKKVIKRNQRDFISKRISLELKDLEQVVYSDSKWIEFILNQIIVNAIKYSKGNNDKIEIESTEEIIQVTTRQSESGRTKRRHQSRSDRHAGNHIPLALGRARHDPRQAAKEGNQDVINGRLRTGQQLALRLADRGNQEKERRSDDAEYRRRGKITEGTLDQVEIGDSQSQAEPHDRPHQRGDQHRTDNHRRRVRIQTLILIGWKKDCCTSRLGTSLSVISMSVRKKRMNSKRSSLSGKA